MTLSSWLRDYLYVPLGGSRDGLIATMRNLMLTMLLGGLWHGANWTFLAWGCYHGLLLCVERAIGVRAFFATRRPWPLRAVATSIAFLFVLFGWVLFRAQNFPDARFVAASMFARGGAPALLDTPLLLLVAVAFAFELRAETRWPRIRQSSLVWRGGVAVALLFVLELGSYPGEAAQFIYFKF